MSAPKTQQAAPVFLADADCPPLISGNGLADWSLDRAIRRHVADVLDYTGGDLGWAASELGVNPSTLYRWRLVWTRGRRIHPRIEHGLLARLHPEGRALA